MALDSAARHQRDVAAGQSTLFDLFAMPVDDSVSFLDDGEEIPRRERLRWEKELIGLYLSEHPLGDIADELPDYVTAYTGDLAEESDQAKVTIGAIIQSSRRVITRAGSTMLVATVEDLQGSVEVVVFPKVFEQTANAWTDDSRVLITGRVDHRDEGSQVLCEAVHAWEDALRMGPQAFAAERDRLLRARPGRPGGGNGNGRPVVPMPIDASPAVALAVEAPVALLAAVGDESVAPAEAVPLQSAPVGAEATISIIFAGALSADRLQPALEAVQSVLRGRPGPLPVVVSIEGAPWRVKLPEQVAWDDRIDESVRQAAGLPVRVELSSAFG